ncbi:MAG: DUF1761 domain-containing protein [Holophagales bacterium]|nr:MAG: DUF1761 domain-containing protein [Holophagales bacterium]
MKILPVIVAGFSYFALGGLWFTPLFGRQWDTAVGFQRPPKWRPTWEYYLVPLAGCLIAVSAAAFLLESAHAHSLVDHLRLGAVVGLGFGATITTVNAVAPNMPRPGLYAAVVGSYHLVGLVLASLVLYGLS